jgi:hypothetical protein
MERFEQFYTDTIKFYNLFLTDLIKIIDEKRNF